MDGYMRYRDSVVVNVSYYYGFSRLPQAPQGQQEPAGGDPAYVAASIVSTALEFRRLIAKGLLEPEKAGKEGELCMESYKWCVMRPGQSHVARARLLTRFFHPQGIQRVPTPCYWIRLCCQGCRGCARSAAHRRRQERPLLLGAFPGQGRTSVHCRRAPSVRSFPSS